MPNLATVPSTAKFTCAKLDREPTVDEVFNTKVEVPASAQEVLKNSGAKEESE